MYDVLSGVVGGLGHLQILGPSTSQLLIWIYSFKRFSKKYFYRPIIFRLLFKQRPWSCGPPAPPHMIGSAWHDRRLTVCCLFTYCTLVVSFVNFPGFTWESTVADSSVCSRSTGRPTCTRRSSAWNGRPPGRWTSWTTEPRAVRRNRFGNT